MTKLEKAGIRQIVNDKIESWMDEAERLRKRQAGWHDHQASQKLAEEVEMRVLIRCAKDLETTLREILGS